MQLGSKVSCFAVPYSGGCGSLGQPGWPSAEAGDAEPSQGVRAPLSLRVGGSSEQPSACSRNRARPQLDLGKGGGCWRALRHLFSLCLPAQKLLPHPSKCLDGPRPVRKAQAQKVTAWRGHIGEGCSQTPKQRYERAALWDQARRQNW